MENCNVPLGEHTVICEPGPLGTRQTRNKHQQRSENHNNKEDHETTDQKLKRLQGLASIKNTISQDSGENSTLRKEDWRICVGALPYETQSSTTVGMGWHEIQLKPAD